MEITLVYIIKTHVTCNTCVHVCANWTTHTDRLSVVVHDETNNSISTA